MQGKKVKMIDRDQRECLVSLLFLADDTVLVTESTKRLECSVAEFGKVCEGSQLRVNVEKRKLWWSNGRGCTPSGR